ncbi:MAG: thiamine-phosphate kinase [Magnetococcales bacterium]|nr:thiamine-phosphate kinase [Magnetococcales bacterium]
MEPLQSETQTIATVGEFQLIQRVLAPLAADGASSSGVVIGAGDDAAVVTVPRTQQLVVSTDTLVEGVHFTADAEPFVLGQKALAVNLSDLAAMGAQPRWYLLSLALPAETPVAWVDGLVAGLKEATRRPGAAVVLIGGNTTGIAAGCRTITITMMGLVGKDRGVSRAGAQVGDHILVTGTVGDAALGWAIQRGSLAVAEEADRAALIRRHQLPEPPLQLAMALQESAFSRGAIDISDGLVADLRHLCLASGVGAQVEADRLPLSPAARRQLERHGTELLTRMLAGGEDYELLFTVAPAVLTPVRVLAESLGVVVTEIGVITAGSEVVVNHPQGPLRVGGWDHFGS